MAGSVQFQLFAPRNTEVALIGSFSNGQVIPMQKENDGYFRTQVDLEDGVYQYQFRVKSKSWHLEPDQWVEVNDPYATEIDQDSQQGIVRIKEGQRILDTYVWQHDDQPLPPDTDVIIYEMHIADFCGRDPDATLGNRFYQAIAKLDYLADLGVNAVELMPVTEYAGNYRWGYMVRHFFAPESSYGPPEDLKRFIDECHARQIRVFMDGIYNHSDEESPLLSIDRDYWYYHGAHYPDDPNNYWGPEFNYDYYDETLDIKPAWKFIGDAVRHWVREYHIDGIRFDAVRQLANADFLHWIVGEARQTAGNKPFYAIAEYIPDTASITCCNSGPMDSCWHESFRYFLIPHLAGETFELDQLKEALDAKRQGYGGSIHVINYLASHDRERLLRELGDRSIFGEPAFQRAKLGAVIQMTAMGIPMLWMGDEFGEYTAKTETTLESNKLQWNLLKQAPNQDLHNFYKRLIALRHHCSALRSDNIEFFHDNPGDRVFAYVRWNDDGSRAVVVANFSDQDFTQYTVPNFPDHSRWYDWLSDRQVEAQDNCLVTELGAYEAKVFVSV
ncbi:alpha amylase C-terminal domain-containing protein [Oscillatoria sp. FACHB-1407]|uniref:alpha-amylase family glycosyl hydrolase n=1 Tax=Oscillatoria sp. FACHB-1407 TaxID=2692847 RepID=UPI0016876241|nr:alpha-amylase family glycosyl hydrolase [Oscillatoria sp. FACHB-1407]MBD2464569.1 alpha amylase C-terminal domain-containing protein [Oscillatoria sp. FACHB-1407]